MKYSSIRHFSLRECSIKDHGLYTFFLGYTTSWPIVPYSHHSTQHSSDFSPPIVEFLSILDSYLDSDETLVSSFPSIVVLDLSYNKITNYSLLDPIFQSPLIGISELHLSGNKYDILSIIQKYSSFLIYFLE